MRLADFIDAQATLILEQWQEFAVERLPHAPAMHPLALQDHAEQVLRAIASYLRSPPSHAHRVARLPGSTPIPVGAPGTVAQLRSLLRARGDLSLRHLVSGYRALRASVLLLWSGPTGTATPAIVAEDVVRFNELIDQAIAETVDFFSEELDRAGAERARADRELSLSRARLAYATRLSGVGFWYCDLPFEVLDWDERVKEHFFFEPTARITIDDFYARIHPEDREATRLAIETSIRDRSAYDITYRTQHPSDGQVKWIRALGGADYGPDGAPIHFDGVTVDVSAQKRDEQRLAESEARHRGVLTNMDEGFTLFDRDFNILDVNEAACRLARLPRSELIGRNHWERFPGTFDSDLGRMYRRVQARRMPEALEHRYEFEDGRRRWIETRAFAVGEGIAVLFRDVTERLEIVAQLREADRRKDEFLAMLAHELRNPIAPIRSAAEVLSREPSVEAARAATAMIQRQAAHLSRLVEDLLDVARITRGQIRLRTEPVDVATIVAQAIETCAPQRDARRQRLTVVAPRPGSVHVEGDLARLVQCLGNVLSNAIKYTDPGGEIALRVSTAGDEVMIEVADPGTGIAPELLPRIFDLFVQSDRTLDRAQGGLGIGLAVVRKLMQMHGGEVSARSAGAGLGSTFELRLPRSAAPASPPPPVAPAGPLRRVLVVDDNVDGANSLVMLLELQGHIARAAYSAREGLRYVDEFRPDVMLIDIGLPEMDGYALVRQLLGRPRGRDIVKVALTGYGQPEDRRRALDAGFDEHLVKPADLSALERTLGMNPGAGRMADPVQLAPRESPS